MKKYLKIKIMVAILSIIMCFIPIIIGILSSMPIEAVIVLGMFIMVIPFTYWILIDLTPYGLNHDIFG